MNYGAQIFINGTSFDVLNSMAANYMLDFITGGAGTRTYDIPEGKALKTVTYTTGPNDATPPTVTVSGKTVSWSASANYTILVYAGA